MAPGGSYDNRVLPEFFIIHALKYPNKILQMFTNWSVCLFIFTFLS